MPTLRKMLKAPKGFPPDAWNELVSVLTGLLKMKGDGRVNVNWNGGVPMLGLNLREHPSGTGTALANIAAGTVGNIDITVGPLDALVSAGLPPAPMYTKFAVTTGDVGLWGWTNEQLMFVPWCPDTTAGATTVTLTGDVTGTGSVP